MNKVLNTPRKHLFVQKTDAENILRLVQEDVALLLLFLEWDSCQMKALQERSLNK